MSPEEHYQKGMEHFGEDQLEPAIEELTQAVGVMFELLVLVVIGQ